ncbi:MAG TPA: tetratricopeptide repeat protein [Acidobacteriota bacterium]
MAILWLWLLWLQAADPAADPSSDPSMQAAESQPAARHQPEAAREALQAGRERAQAGEPRAALAAFDQALRLDPTLREALVERGRALLALRDFERAESDLRAALEMEPDDLETLKLLAGLLQGRERFADSAEILGRIEALDPADPDVATVRGTMLAQAGDFPAAEAAYLRALTIDPNHPNANYGLGLLYARYLDQPELAIPRLEAATRLSPDNASAWYLLASTRDRGGDAAGAREAVQAALATDPDHLEAHNLLARLLRQAGDAEGARRELERFAELSREREAEEARRRDLRASFDAATLELRVGRLEAAERLLDSVLKLEPEHDGAHAMLAKILLSTRREAEARAHLSRALAARPDYYEYLYLDALLRSRSGESEAAMESLARAEADHPGFAEIYNLRGNLLLQDRRYDEAIESYRRALELEPRNAAFRLNLSSALSAAGRESEAEEERQRILGSS